MTIFKEIDANTADLYSYQDNTYIEDIQTKNYKQSGIGLLLNSTNLNSQYLELLHPAANLDNNMFNYPKPSPSEASISKSYQNAYENNTNKNSYSTLNIFDSKYLKATVPCQQDQQNQKNEIFHPNSK